MLRRLVLFLLLATHSGLAFAAEGTPTSPVVVPPGEYTPLEAALAIARQAKLGVVAGPLPTDRAKLEWAPCVAEDVPSRLSQAFPMDVVCWRGLLLVQSRQAASLDESLRGAAPPERHPHLWRPPDPPGEIPPGYQVVMDAVRVLAKPADPVDWGRLAPAAYWLAATPLREMVRWHAAVEAGSALVAVQPRAPTPEDPCPRHLVVIVPRRNDADPQKSLRRVFHGPDFDAYARALQEQKGIIPLEEFVRRLHEKALRERDPLGKDDALGRVVSPDLRDQGAGALLDALAAAGVRVTLAPESADRRLSVVASEACARDLLCAGARVLGLTLSRGPADAPYSLHLPQCPREAMPLKVPLEIWALLAGTEVECDRQLVLLTRRLRQPLDTDSQAPVRVRRVADLAPEPRRALLSLACNQVARDLGALLPALPDSRGAVPLRLYRTARFGQFELAGICGSEFIKGLAYVNLERELSEATGVSAPTQDLGPKRPGAKRAGQEEPK